MNKLLILLTLFPVLASAEYSTHNRFSPENNRYSPQNNRYAPENNRYNPQATNVLRGQSYEYKGYAVTTSTPYSEEEVTNYFNEMGTWEAYEKNFSNR